MYHNTCNYNTENYWPVLLFPHITPRNSSDSKSDSSSDSKSDSSNDSQIFGIRSPLCFTNKEPVQTAFYLKELYQYLLRIKIEKKFSLV